MKPLITHLLILLLCLACSGNRNALLQKAESHIESNEFDKAKRIYQTLIDDWPEDVIAIEGMIKAAKIQNATEDYRLWCRELLRFRPWSREANIAVGKVCLDDKRLSDAVSRFMLALQESDFQNEKQEAQQLLQKTYILMRSEE